MAPAQSSLVSESWVEGSGFHSATRRSVREACAVVLPVTRERMGASHQQRVDGSDRATQGCRGWISTKQARQVQGRKAPTETHRGYDSGFHGHWEGWECAFPFGLIARAGRPWIQSPVLRGRRGNCSGKSTGPGVTSHGKWTQPWPEPKYQLCILSLWLEYMTQIQTQKKVLQCIWVTPG